MVHSYLSGTDERTNAAPPSHGLSLWRLRRSAPKKRQNSADNRRGVVGGDGAACGLDGPVLRHVDVKRAAERDLFFGV